MGVELTGLEPRLQVLLRCDEESPANIENRVTSRAVTATGVAMAWTDLALDSSAFPYLLNQAQPTWPYAQSSHWGAKGEEPPVTAAVLDEASGTVCWATGNALYGVSSGDGRRLWGVRVAKGVSAPTAFNGWFYVMTPDEGLIAVNAVSGERTIVEAAAQTASKAPPAVNVTAATPVINGKMMVVADMQVGQAQLSFAPLRV